jgi:hypothetical protein
MPRSDSSLEAIYKHAKELAMSNLPAHNLGGTQYPAILDRRERRQLLAIEKAVMLAHVDVQLRRDLAQARILADTAVTQTAMASVTATAAGAAALGAAVPEAAEALAYLQTKHVVNQGRRIDESAQGF